MQVLLGGDRQGVPEPFFYRLVDLQDWNLAHMAMPFWRLYAPLASCASVFWRDQ